MRVLAICVLLLFSSSLSAEVRTDIPQNPDPQKTYIFYLHGKIIESSGPRPTDPRFGVYDYPAVLDALASQNGIVIASQRADATDVDAYAGIIVSKVNYLISHGVPEGNVVVVGFSKGGAIARHVSSFLRRPNVRFVLLASCWADDREDHLRLTGKVLSVREMSDQLANASCRAIAKRSEPPTSFEEIEIDTGKSHGAFYLPLREWVEPVMKWIHTNG